MSFLLRVGAATDQGLVRGNNQDAFRLAPDQDLFIVADGMGGHQGGEVAAQMAVEVIESAYDLASPAELVRAVLEANQRIYDRSVEDPDLRGMGTTAVVAALVPAPGQDDGGGVPGGEGDAELERRPRRGDDTDPGVPLPTIPPPEGAAPVSDDAGTVAGAAAPAASSPALPPAEDGAVQLVIANVGDSRAYLYRDDELIQLTEDHSMVADLVRDGRITPEEAEQHPQRNILTRVLGVYQEIEVDLWPVDPLDGDRYVLCSDGLFNEVGEDAIGAVLRRRADPDQAAEELVRLANEGGGRDNITVVVIDVTGDDGAARAASVAVGSTGHAAEPDLAGFSSAPAAAPAGPDAGSAPPPGTARSGWMRRSTRRSSASAPTGDDARPGTRVTWRVVAFVAVVAIVLGGAYLTVVWYGTSTYHVGFDEDAEVVAIFKGRPGGLLWIDPELVERSPISRDDVPARWLGTIDAGHEQPSLSDARRFVANVARDAGLDEDGQPTTTTTGPTTTTATALAEAPGPEEPAPGPQQVSP